MMLHPVAAGTWGTANGKAGVQLHNLQTAVPSRPWRLRVACSAGNQGFRPIDPTAGKKLTIAPLTLKAPPKSLTEVPAGGPRGVLLVGFSAEEGNTLHRWFHHMEPGFVVSHCPAAVLANQAATLRQALGLSGAAVAPAQPVSAPAAGEKSAAATLASEALPPAAAVSAERVQTAAPSLPALSNEADQVEMPASPAEEQQHELRLLPEQAWEPAPAWVPPVVLFSGMAGEEIVGLIELWPQELDQEATSFAAVSEGLLDKPLARLVLDIAKAKLQKVTSALPVPNEAPAAPAAGASEVAGIPAGDGHDSGVMETEDMPADDESGLSSKVREYMLVNAAGEVESEALSLPVLREKLRNRVQETRDKQAAGEASKGEAQKGKKARKEKHRDPDDDRVRAALLESKKQGRAKGTKGGGFGAATSGRPRGFG